MDLLPSLLLAGSSGIALVIALGQLDNFFGTHTAHSGNLGMVRTYLEQGFHPHWQTMVIGLFVVAFMILWPKKWQAVFPSSLAALIVVLIANAFLKWDVAVVGEIPRTLLPAVRLTPGDIDLASLGGLENLVCPSIRQ